MADFYGEYDGFDVNDDFDINDDFTDESDSSFYDDDDDDDDVWDEFSEDSIGDLVHVDAIAATIIFPIGEDDDIEEVEKKTDDWVEFSEGIFNNENLVNVNDNADEYTYSSVDTEQNYFCYWQ